MGTLSIDGVEENAVACVSYMLVIGLGVLLLLLHCLGMCIWGVRQDGQGGCSGDKLVVGRGVFFLVLVWAPTRPQALLLVGFPLAGHLLKQSEFLRSSSFSLMIIFRPHLRI